MQNEGLSKSTKREIFIIILIEIWIVGMFWLVFILAKQTSEHVEEDYDIKLIHYSILEQGNDWKYCPACGEKLGND